MSKKSLLNEFRNYGIGLVVKFGIPLLMMTASSGVLAQTTTKSNDREVQRVLDLQAENLKAKQALPQYKEDSTIIANNRAVVNALPADVQAKHQKNVYRSSNNPMKMAETFRNIRVDMEAYGNGPAQSTLLMNNIDTYAKNTGRMLRTIIGKYNSKYAEAVSGLSPQQKSELDNIQNNEYGATGAASAAPADFKTSLKQELNKIENYKISVAEKSAELDTLSDMYLTAQWLDRFPTDAVSAAVNAVEELKENKSNSEASEIICLLRNYYHVADADADKFNGASPMNSVMQRKMIIGEIAVQKAEAARVSNNLEVYSSYTQKAYEAAKAGNRKEADRLLNERNGIINARPERVPSDVADNVRAAAIKESFDFDLDVIRSFQEGIKVSRKVIAEADYKFFENEFGVPKNNNENSPIISVAEKRDMLDKEIAFFSDKAGKETSPEHKRILENQVKERQSELKELDNLSKNYVERNRSVWLENNDNLYSNAVEDERIYLDARSGILNPGKTYTVSSDEIAFRNNKSAVHKGKITDITRAQYNTQKDKYLIYYSNKGKYSHVSSHKYLTRYGTGSYFNAAHTAYSNTYGHTGRVGGENSSYESFGVNVSESDMYVTVGVHASMSNQGSGKGSEGVKAITKGVGKDVIIILLNKFVPSN